MPEQLPDDLARIIAAAEIFHLPQDAPERFLGLRDRMVRVVLAMLLETLVMFNKLFAEKFGKTLTWRTEQRLRQPSGLDDHVAEFPGHQGEARDPV